MTKPSEKIVKAPYDGKDIIDSEGRVIKLRKPRILDTYDLLKALGDDAKNQSLFFMSYNTLYVAMIDGVMYQCPKTNSEIRAMLQRLDEHGIDAISKEIAKYETEKSEKEAIESAKK